jgi:hypothetical protein
VERINNMLQITMRLGDTDQSDVNRCLSDKRQGICLTGLSSAELDEQRHDMAVFPACEPAMETVQRIAGPRAVPIDKSEALQSILHAEEAPLPASLAGQLLSPEDSQPRGCIFLADPERKRLPREKGIDHNVYPDYEKTLSLLGRVDRDKLKRMDQRGIELLFFFRCQWAAEGHPIPRSPRRA